MNGCYSQLVNEKKKNKFVPFSVFIMPNTHTILEDFGLIGTTEQDWKDFWKGLEKIPKKGWRIWEDKGFSFTFITRELIYSKDWNMFSSEDINVGAGLEPAIIGESRGTKPGFGPFSPYLTLRLGLDSGCDLRITLEDRYWEQIKDRAILKSIQNEASPDPNCGTVCVTIARLSRKSLSLMLHFKVGITLSHTKRRWKREKENGRAWVGRVGQAAILMAMKPVKTAAMKRCTGIAPFRIKPSNVGPRFPLTLGPRKAGWISYRLRFSRIRSRRSLKSGSEGFEPRLKKLW